MGAKEAKARIKLNKLLESAGWHFFDEGNIKANIVLENNVKFTKQKMNEIGDDFERTAHGYIDFLLLDEKGFPFVVVEAKNESKNPLDGKEQARRYAQSQNVRFIILSNGNLHYLWDLEKGNPLIITTFPTYESLKHFESFTPNFTALADEKVEADYIVLTQSVNYQKDLLWIDKSSRKKFIDEQNLKFLRPYQIHAIQALQKSAQQGKDRYLFEMATGTGKTLVSAAVIKLFLKTGNAKRILFLVDRLELEEQAWKQFIKYLKNDFTCVIYKNNRDDWRKAEIVISTIQSLSFNSKHQKLFSPTDFDLLISDEAHRSIGGNSRAVFEYFVGYKLGLTATPKDYLKNIDPEKINENNPRAWERRQLLDTYRTFGCGSSEPTFRYSLLDGVRDGFLVNPVVADARTEITTAFLSEEGYAVMARSDEDSEEKQTFFLKDFERKFFSDKTNQVFCKTFLENAIKDPLSGEIGKSIIFCVSQKHASKITHILNQFADQLWPGTYQSDFAVQITSNIPAAQQYTSNFAYNKLNGKTQWLENYQSSKTRICVTVGMMTTGYDCEDILNLCLMRPIFSPTDFIQIKGRGTRKYLFKIANVDGDTDRGVEKETFKLFDFFANCEYFEEKYNYDEILKLPIEVGNLKIDRNGTAININEVNIFTPDPLKTFSETLVGSEGMKVDRKFYEKFEEDIKNDPVAKEKYESGDIAGVEEYVRNEIFNKPQDFYNLDKLLKAIKSDRRISLREIIEKIFGGIMKFKTKEELLEDEVEKFIAIYKPDNKYILPIKNFLKAYITDAEIRNIVETKEYSRFATNPKINMKDFKELEGWRETIPEYVKDYVSMNIFM